MSVLFLAFLGCVEVRNFSPDPGQLACFDNSTDCSCCLPNNSSATVTCSSSGPPLPGQCAMICSPTSAGCAGPSNCNFVDFSGNDVGSTTSEGWNIICDTGSCQNSVFTCVATDSCNCSSCSLFCNGTGSCTNTTYSCPNGCQVSGPNVPASLIVLCGPGKNCTSPGTVLDCSNANVCNCTVSKCQLAIASSPTTSSLSSSASASPSASASTAPACTTAYFDCASCMAAPGCGWCISDSAIGCVGNSLEGICDSIGGVWNNCSYTGGTPCAQNKTCDSCQASTSCAWCSSPSYSACLANDFIAETLCGSASPNTTFNLACPGAPAPPPTPSVPPPPPRAIPWWDPNAKCEAFSEQSCSGTVFYDVLVNDTYKQPNAAEQAQYILGILNSLPGVSVACRSVATLLLCGLYFQRCEVYNYPPLGDLTYYTPPCRNLCLSVNSECAESLEQLGQDPLPCLDTSAVTGLAFFPESDLVYPLPDGTSFTRPCNSMDISGEGEYLPNRLVNGGFESFEPISKLPYNWTIAGGVPVVVNDTVFDPVALVTTNSSVLQFNGSAASQFSISQTVSLVEFTPSGLRISGLVRAENDVGPKDSSFSLQLFIPASSFNVSNLKKNATACNGDPPQDVLLEAYFESGTYPYTRAVAEIDLCYTVSDVEYRFNYKGRTGTIYVENLQLEEKVPEAYANCIPPFYYRDDYAQQGLDSPCQLQCPFTLYPIDQHRAVIKGRNVMSGLSFFCLLFVFITWIGRKRKQQEQVDSGIIHLSASIFIVNISDLLPLFRPGGWPAMECQDSPNANGLKFQYVNMSTDGLCAVTGALTQFGSISALYWWAMICFNLAFVTWKLKKPALCGSTRRVKFIYGAISYGLGIITTSVALGLGQIGAGIAASGCWVMGAFDPRMQFWLLYYHILFVMAIGGPAVVYVMITLYRTRKKAGFEKAHQGQLRLAAFGGFLLINFITLVTYRFWLYNNTDRLTADYGKEVACGAAPGANSESCDDIFKTPSVGLLAWNSSVTSIDGVLLFLLFGATRSTVAYWKQCCRRGNIHSQTTEGSKVSHDASRLDAAFSDGNSNRTYVESDMPMEVFNTNESMIVVEAVPDDPGRSQVVNETALPVPDDFVYSRESLRPSRPPPVLSHLSSSSESVMAVNMDEG